MDVFGLVRPLPQAVAGRGAPAGLYAAGVVAAHWSWSRIGAIVL
jgi:hypothetical protein